MEDHPGYLHWTAEMVVVGGIVAALVFAPDNAPPDYAPGEVGAKVAQITFGSTTVASAQPEMENTVIGRNFNVIPPDPAYKVAADGFEGGLLKDMDPQSPMRWSRIIITDPSSGSVPSS